MNPELLIQGEQARLIIINVHSFIPRKMRGLPLWSLVSSITGHGSGYSQQICLSAKLDPNQRCGVAQLKDVISAP